jgi:glycosyltransferase involved in cell wall biosynthesis
MHIVFLSRWYPFPADNGSKIRIYNLLRQLGRRHDVTLLTFAGPTDRVDTETLGVLHQTCREVSVFPYREFRRSSARATIGLFSSEPRYLVDTFNEELAGALDEVLARHTTDAIVASELAMMPYPLRVPAWPSVMEELELAVFRDAATLPLRKVSSARARLTWLKLAGYLRRSLGAFAASTVVSEKERRLVGEVAPHVPAPYVVPNAIDAQSYVGDFGSPEPDALVFSGALTYAPNFDGARWFLRAVYPRIQAHLPSSRFRITGGTNGVNLAALPTASGLELTGYVPDVRPVVARSAVSVVPLRSGGGTRLKILESMALGTPVVSTSKGAEGLDVTHGENILIADDPAELADAVLMVVRDPSLRARLSANGKALVQSRYDWDVIGPMFRDIVEQAVESRTSGPSRWFA